MEVNADRLYSADTGNCFLYIGAAVVAAHAFHNVVSCLVLTLLSLFMTAAMTRVAMTVVFVTVTFAIMTMSMFAMTVTAAAGTLVHESHAERVEEQECHDGCACPGKPTGLFVAACVGTYQVVYEPSTRQQVVYAKTEGDGS